MKHTKKLAQKLRDYMATHGLSFRKLAELTGIDHSTIFYFLSKNRGLNYETGKILEDLTNGKN